MPSSRAKKVWYFIDTSGSTQTDAHGEPEELRLLRGRTDVRTLRGWRRDLVGAELLELLGGEMSLRADPAGGIAVAKPGTDP